MSGPWLFHSPVWLEAVAPGAWSTVTIERGGEVVASMPLVRTSRRGMTLLTMPPLTPTLGPWIRPSEGKYVTRHAREIELLTELIEKIPPHDYFYQQFHYSSANSLPFHWAGFTQTTRYTYVLDELDDVDRVWGDFDSHTRKAVRKAERLVKVRDDLGLGRFLELNEMTFRRQGLVVPHSRALVGQLDAALAREGQRRILFAEDAAGHVHSALYLVWNEDAAYYLMGGSDPDHRSSGAATLLLWEAIKHAAKVSRRFDFEGSMIEPIARFFRGFGAKQMPYAALSRESARRRAATATRDAARALHHAARSLLPR